MSTSSEIQTIILGYAEGSPFGVDDVIKSLGSGADVAKIKPLIYASIQRLKTLGKVFTVRRGVYAVGSSQHEESFQGEYAWADDPVLRAYMLEEHPCVGYWCPTSPVCADCPLSRECAEVLANNLVRLSDVIRNANNTPGLPEVMSVIGESLTEDASRKTPKRPQGSRVLLAAFPTVCASTGRAIVAGDKVVYENGKVSLVETEDSDEA
jgi:hypothetical protein